MNKWLVVFISATCLAWFGCRAQEETPEVDVIEADVIEGEAVMDVPTDVPPEAEADVLEEEEEQE